MEEEHDIYEQLGIPAFYRPKVLKEKSDLLQRRTQSEVIPQVVMRPEKKIMKHRRSKRIVDTSIFIFPSASELPLPLEDSPFDIKYPSILKNNRKSE